MFVIISGDSDFSPLVSKLRENDKKVIGLGVKKASSDLLIENCDEFIYYDDLVRERRQSAKKEGKGAGRGSGRGAGTGRGGQERETAKPLPGKKPRKQSEKRGEPRKGEPESRKADAALELARPEVASRAVPDGADEVGSKEEALELVLDTVEALFRDRDDNLWGSMVKQTLKRKKPNFAETFYGYRTFNHLLEDAQRQGLLDIQKDEKSGGYLILSFGPEA
jgi:hypothetical protein